MDGVRHRILYNITITSHTAPEDAPAPAVMRVRSRLCPGRGGGNGWCVLRDDRPRCECYGGHGGPDCLLSESEEMTTTMEALEWLPTTNTLTAAVTWLWWRCSYSRLPNVGREWYDPDRTTRAPTAPAILEL
ncbi:unnamed protein product [Caenorhabditis auriculariae]|uniref:EGF-like domain-containing protein n=1 Tax=Caenorhabditis auriculariae TaxID=2777116 RepID=A0A8S1GZY1_9PELO|nr:unnamed protein product [Caenorhabditis auriculariae]